MSKNNSNDGISVLGLLGVSFVVLKLTNFIDWSWWYVTLPFWGGLVLVLLVLGVYFLYKLIKISLKTKKRGVPTYKNPPPPPPPKKSRFRERLDEAMREAESKIE